MVTMPTIGTHNMNVQIQRNRQKYRNGVNATKVLIIGKL